MTSQCSVWIVNQYATPPSRGGWTRHYDLAKRLQDHGIDPLVVAGASDDAAGTARVADGVAFRWLRVRGYAGNGLARVLSMVLFAGSVLTLAVRPVKRRPDVVIGSSPHLFAAAAAWLVARRHRARFIVEVRDIWPKSLTELVGLSPKHPFAVALGILERFLYRRADAIVGLMPGLGEHVAKVAPGVESVAWVPNGTVVADRPVTQPTEVEDFRLVYTGAHGVPNALDVVIRSAHQLRDRATARGGRFRFLLVGDGVDKAELVEVAQSLGLDNVEFRPPVPKGEVAGLLAGADALLLTARKTTDLYRYGVSPNKLFDYFAAARPILMGMETPYDPVAQAGAGISIAAEDADALTAAILELDAMPLAERAEMGRRGRRYVEENHDMDGLAKRLAGVVYSVL